MLEATKAAERESPRSSSHAVPVGMNTGAKVSATDAFPPQETHGGWLILVVLKVKLWCEAASLARASNRRQMLQPHSLDEKLLAKSNFGGV